MYAYGVLCALALSLFSLYLPSYLSFLHTHTHHNPDLPSLEPSQVLLVKNRLQEDVAVHPDVFRATALAGSATPRTGFHAVCQVTLRLPRRNT